MKRLLDDEPLDGPHDVRISYRPERLGLPVATGDVPAFIGQIQSVCQRWGGGTSPLVPTSLDGSIDPTYCALLPGSNIDSVRGLPIHGLFHLPNVKVGSDDSDGWHGAQFAFAVLESQKQDEIATLEVLELDDSDPWKPIYASCLGLLPERPDADLLEQGYLRPDLSFDDFVNVKRRNVTGSLDDLVDRISNDQTICPRALSMVRLQYGNPGSSSIRTGNQVLPDSSFAQIDAGPNVIVLCSRDSVEDFALLWNLRSAYGDRRILPIGIPQDQVNEASLRLLSRHPRISRNGIPFRSAYVTSASLTLEELSHIVGSADDEIGIGSYQEMLTLGTPGRWSRDEVTVWNDGRTQYVPLPVDSQRDVFEKGALGDRVRMYFDLHVLSSPFPVAPVRVRTMNGEFYAGSQSNWSTPPYRGRLQNAVWPNRMLMARSIAGAKGLDLRESPPGRAARIVLLGLGSLDRVANLAHAPLLELLEGMAARQGISWYKERLRNEGKDADPAELVGAVVDDLPERSFGDFKIVLGNNTKATKYWLHWAEESGLIVKGFQLECSHCAGQQWTPVSAFAPPIICRGCAEEMTTPFGRRDSVSFRYRMSERLRRVYEQDAIGHLLVARYLDGVLGGARAGRVIGVHPGMELVRPPDQNPIAEVDVLLLTGGGEFVPAEVKRTARGFDSSQVTKLTEVSDLLSSPWSVAMCCEYGADVSSNFSDLGRKGPGGTHDRITLTYDAVLDPFPGWRLGSDPFEWNVLSSEQIEERERSFVTRLADSLEFRPHDLYEEFMLHPPKLGD